jgi:hypothetical protein
VAESNPQITYTQYPSAAAEAEASVLASVYRFVTRSSQAKRKAGGSDAGEDDARRIKNACTAEEKHTGT